MKKLKDIEWGELADNIVDTTQVAALITAGVLMLGVVLLALSFALYVLSTAFGYWLITPIIIFLIASAGVAGYKYLCGDGNILR